MPMAAITIGSLEVIIAIVDPWRVSSLIRDRTPSMPLQRVLRMGRKPAKLNHNLVVKFVGRASPAGIAVSQYVIPVINRVAARAE